MNEVQRTQNTLDYLNKTSLNTGDREGFAKRVLPRIQVIARGRLLRYPSLRGKREPLTVAGEALAGLLSRWHAIEIRDRDHLIAHARRFVDHILKMELRSMRTAKRRGDMEAESIDQQKQSGLESISREIDPQEITDCDERRAWMNSTLEELQIEDIDAAEVIGLWQLGLSIRDVARLLEITKPQAEGRFNRAKKFIQVRYPKEWIDDALQWDSGFDEDAES